MQCLEGIRVLDFTQVVAGPVCTMLLGDLGADVIKIEPPEGDAQRRVGEAALGGESAGFLSVNRNKRSVVVDLRTAGGREFVQGLAAHADIVVENFRPGVADRLGIGYPALSKLNSRLIHCSISGFGQSGPYRERAGMDQIVQAFSGIMQLTGSMESGPLRTGFPFADLAAPLFATIGILGALQARHKSGRGQQVDVSMLNAALFGMTPREQIFFATGKPPQRHGNGNQEIVPCNTYETSDGRLLMIMAHTDKFWRILVEALPDETLRHDPRLASKTGRVQHRALVDERLAAVFRTAPLEEWTRRLAAAEVLFAPVRDLGEVFGDPFVRDEMLVEMAHPVIGKFSMLGNPIRLSDTPVSSRRPPPTLGEHTEEVRRRAPEAVCE